VDQLGNGEASSHKKLTVSLEDGSSWSLRPAQVFKIFRGFCLNAHTVCESRAQEEGLFYFTLAALQRT